MSIKKNSGSIIINIFVTILLLQSTSFSQKSTYKPTWESLGKYPVPEWFRDAKFGIYTHWGIYSVPAFGNEWYPRRMYLNGDKINKHHQEVWGDQTKFGYKDFIPMFKAEKFNADEWAELFVKSGAKFAGPVAEHHDGFPMWNSKYDSYNAYLMGPKRDVVGELAKAVKKKGLKLVTSFHHAENWFYYPKWNEKFDTADPRFVELYGPVHDVGMDNDSEKKWKNKQKPSQEYMKLWHDKLIEVIDKYDPDLMWFDFGLDFIQESFIKDYIAYYYNKSVERKKQVAVTYKDHDLPAGVGIVDYERGRATEQTYFVWLTDTSVGERSWCYIDGETYKPVNTLIDVLVDIVSNNGCMLLNVGPKADGTIPDEAKERLSGMGEWLKVNGEAIYETRPWTTIGEGPTRLEKAGSFNEKNEVTYTAQDIRFTTKGNALYAICLDWPGEKLIVKSLAPTGTTGSFDGEIKSVILLGDGKELEWQLTKEGLVIVPPKNKPCDYAFTFKISR